MFSTAVGAGRLREVRVVRAYRNVFLKTWNIFIRVVWGFCRGLSIVHIVLSDPFWLEGILDKPCIIRIVKLGSTWPPYLLVVGGYEFYKCVFQVRSVHHQLTGTTRFKLWITSRVLIKRAMKKNVLCQFNKGWSSTVHTMHLGMLVNRPLLMQWNKGSFRCSKPLIREVWHI